MTDEDQPTPLPASHLSSIETTWRRRSDPLRFTMVYAQPIRRLLLALLRDEHEADDALQQLLTRMTEQGFPTFDPDRGKFRDYLKEVVRNAAWKQRRGLAQRQQPAGTDLDQLGRAEPDHSDRVWLEEWRGCLLEQALRALERHQQEAGRGNLSYTVIRLSIENPGADSRHLARRAGELSGQPLTPEAYRKQLSRARRTFASLLVSEIQQTLDGASAEGVLEELAELGLLEYVRDFLPEHH